MKKGLFVIMILLIPLYGFSQNNMREEATYVEPYMKSIPDKDSYIKVEETAAENVDTCNAYNLDSDINDDEDNGIDSNYPVHNHGHGHRHGYRHGHSHKHYSAHGHGVYHRNGASNFLLYFLGTIAVAAIIIVIVSL